MRAMILLYTFLYFLDSILTFFPVFSGFDSDFVYRRFFLFILILTMADYIPNEIVDIALILGVTEILGLPRIYLNRDQYPNRRNPNDTVIWNCIIRFLDKIEFVHNLYHPKLLSS